MVSGSLSWALRAMRAMRRFLFLFGCGNWSFGRRWKQEFSEELRAKY